MASEHVKGKNKGEIVLYALSTCQWCRKTRELLQQLGVEFDVLYVDNLEGKEQEDAMNAVEKVNPRGSFPTLVINGRRCIVGFREDEIKEVLS